jgi:hypothetical protein
MDVAEKLLALLLLELGLLDELLLDLRQALAHLHCRHVRQASIAAEL